MIAIGKLVSHLFSVSAQTVYSEDRTAIGLSLAHAIFPLDFRKEALPHLSSVSAHTLCIRRNGWQLVNR